MNPATAELLDLFPDAAFRHRMRFRRASVAEFFGPSAAGESLLAQRRRWLEGSAADYVGALPGSERLLEETLGMFRSAGLRLADLPQGDFVGSLEILKTMGRRLEPDWMLLGPDDSGVLRLMAGCVCFPSSWSLPEKMGLSVEQIHAIVPDLNQQIGGPIAKYLAKLPSGAASQRSNWGLSRSPAWNQHPSQRIRTLDAEVEIEDVWLRVEHQIFARLPDSGGVLFGVRLANHPLAELQRCTELRRRFRTAIETISEPMAQYKNFATARARLLHLFGGTTW